MSDSERLEDGEAIMVSYVESFAPVFYFHHPETYELVAFNSSSEEFDTNQRDVAHRLADDLSDETASIQIIPSEEIRYKIIQVVSEGSTDVER